MERQEATIDMLDEVSRDMRLEWPGRRPRGERVRFPEPYQETPLYTRRGGE
jgi:hypothetical protein